MGIAYDVLELQEHADSMAAALEANRANNTPEENNELDRYEKFKAKIAARDWPGDELATGESPAVDGRR